MTVITIATSYHGTVSFGILPTTVSLTVDAVTVTSVVTRSGELTLVRVARLSLDIVNDI